MIKKIYKRFFKSTQKNSSPYYKFSPKLDMWFDEALKEKNIDLPKTHDYAIYPQRFYKSVEKLSQDKKYDFLFIGGYNTDKETVKNRKWIIPFIQQYFTRHSYLQFTDEKTKKKYVPMGEFDYTLKQEGFVPKSVPYEQRNFFDENYFERMCHSKFCLCPAGDVMYSMRFYEALMCKTIPVVNCVEETYRTEKESKLDYKFYLASDKNIEYNQEWVDHNYNLFIQHHTFENL